MRFTTPRCGTITSRRWLCVGLAAVMGCGSRAAGAPTHHTDGGHVASDGSATETGVEGGTGSDTGSDAGIDAGVDAGPPAITCSNPGSYTNNGGACGVERWAIKTGTDSQAAGISLVPTPTTITALRAPPAAGGGSSRESPTETTLWELKDVILTELRLEADSDEHLVVTDPSSASDTMIIEVPYPSCATASPWLCFITHVRSELDAKFPNISTSPQFPSVMVTVRGVGFFDTLHGQTGVAPNGVELHAVLQICFGQGCTPT